MFLLTSLVCPSILIFAGQAETQKLVYEDQYHSHHVDYMRAVIEEVSGPPSIR